ncbi:MULTISPECIES: O-antigen polymerase [unclassified Pseudomonas]|uniref:O-antigen polymerase n=1 Tax=unclassified Pseudomonas TaxID=196821 RepID=UPI0035C17B9D
MGNPVVVFSAVWGSVLLLYCLGATSNLVPINIVGLSLVVLNMLSMALFYLLMVAGRRVPLIDKTQIMEYRRAAKVYAKVLFVLWFGGTCMEVYVQRGFPLYWNWVGDGRLYTDFGIPSFHGIMNAMYLQLVTALAYLYFVKPRRIIILLLFLLACWPVLMLGRGILLSVIVQITAVFFLMRRLNIKVTLILISSALVAVFLFGYVGDLRQVVNPFGYLVEPAYVDFFSSMPSGFLWFYVYMTSGMSNLFFNIETLQPAYSVGYSLYNMLPSALKLWLGFDQRNDLFVFVDNNLNAATFYSGYISDFGPVGAFLLAAFVQFCCCLAYRVARNGRPWGILAYAVAFQILIFSIFYDMFFLLPVLFQFAMAILFFSFYQFTRRSKVRVDLPLAEPSSDPRIQ